MSETVETAFVRRRENEAWVSVSPKARVSSAWELIPAHFRSNSIWVGPPSATTGAATAVGETVATLEGIGQSNGSYSNYKFEYGLTTSYGSSSPVAQLGNLPTPVTKTASITGLINNNTYHYRLVVFGAESSPSGTAYGEDKTFTTSAVKFPPVVVTGGISAITESGATLEGTVNPSSQASTWWYEIGTTTGYGTSTSHLSAGSGSSPVPETATVSGLLANTLYHYRIVANNVTGTSSGEDKTFTTEAAKIVAPVVTVNGLTIEWAEQFLASSWTVAISLEPAKAGRVTNYVAIKAVKGTQTVQFKAGEVFKSNATLFGEFTPAAGQTLYIGVAARELSGPYSFPESLVAIPPLPTVTNPGNQTATAGVALELQPTGTNVSVWSATNLPAGLTMNSSTGKITGTPTTATTYSTTITVTNSSGSASTPAFTWTVNAPITPPTITSPGNVLATSGNAAKLAIVSTNATSFSASALPTGMSISTTTGEITGTPSATGTFKPTVTATNGGGSKSVEFEWVINNTLVPTLTLNAIDKQTVEWPNNLSVTEWIIGLSTESREHPNRLTAYTYQATTSGTQLFEPETGVKYGGAPKEITPIAGQTLYVGIAANKPSSAYSASEVEPIMPGGGSAPTVTKPASQIGYVKTVAELQIQATNTTTYAATNLPAGLTLNTSTGKITGTPTTVETDTVHIEVTGSGGKATTEFSWAINNEVGAIVPIVIPSNGTTTISLTAGGKRLVLKGPAVWALQDHILGPFGLEQYNERFKIFKTLKNWGSNCARIRILESDYKKEAFMTKATYINQAKGLAEAAINEKLYPIFCSWDPSDGEFTGKNWAGHGNVAEGLFTDLHNALGANEWVIYEPYNEPHEISWAQWQENFKTIISFFRGTLGYKGLLILDPLAWANSGTKGEGYSDAEYTAIENFDAGLSGMGGKHALAFAKHDYANNSNYNGTWNQAAWEAAVGGSQIKHLIWEGEFGNYNGSEASVNETWSQNAAKFFATRAASQSNFMGLAPFVFGNWKDKNAITLSNNETPTKWGGFAKEAIEAESSKPLPLAPILTVKGQTIEWPAQEGVTEWTVAISTEPRKTGRSSTYIGKSATTGIQSATFTSGVSFGGFIPIEGERLFIGVAAKSPSGPYSEVEAEVLIAATKAPTITNPGTQKSTINSATELKISATAATSYSAEHLPTGLSINVYTGVILGTPTKNETQSSVKITATNSLGSQSATFSWTISATPSVIVGVNTEIGLEHATAAKVMTALGVTADRMQFEKGGSTNLKFGYTFGASKEYGFIPGHSVAILEWEYHKNLKGLVSKYLEQVKGQIDAAVANGIGFVEYGNELWAAETSSLIERSLAYGEILWQILKYVDEKGYTNKVKILADASYGVQWLNGLSAANAGIKTRLDGFSYHTYGSLTSGHFNSLSSLRTFQKEASEQGYTTAAQNFYITETGWNVTGKFNVEGECETYAQQAQYLHEMLDQFKLDSWIKGVWYFSMIDGGEGHWGCVDGANKARESGVVMGEYAKGTLS